ncbi:hypothetical protein [Bacillus sp. S/N-304-OC-R1]|uniref:hypothetical protein n=1 Tax=Bacillus sp. S/N-304-OC-R1 TaxID=2758034 RepID=UPI001C8E6C90|nr:hypothetical protein [Bacillus sp. S/N-304-OC-R1]MBY0121660.1 hypothetical protein [Bacillus sp. S/N-304-OC-R1]
MLRSLVYILITLFLLTACTRDTVVPIETIQEQQEDKNIVVSDDGEITFKIFNNIKVTDEKIDSIKQELLNAYNHIQKSIKTDYVPSEKINVILNEGNQSSWGLRSELKLYGVRKNQHPLVHELTHSLLGYGNNFDSSTGYLTQEGFATYMEDMYGKTKSYSHQYMRYFIDSNKRIYINKLIDLNQDDSFFRPALINTEDYTLQWMSYIHAASFVTYLIESYGLEKFEQIYNKEDLANKIEDIYGKNISELENDWISFINETQKELTYEDKLKMRYFYTWTSAIDQIDSKFFTKD